MFGLRLPNFVESCQMSEYQIYTLSSAGDCADDHVSNEKRPGCLGCIGDYTIQYMGILISQYKDPFKQPV